MRTKFNTVNVLLQSYVTLQYIYKFNNITLWPASDYNKKCTRYIKNIYKQHNCLQAQVIFQYNYKHNISLDKDLIDRTYSIEKHVILLCKQIPRFMFKTSLPRIKISVVSTNEVVTRPYGKPYVFSHNFSGKVITFVWRNVTTNGTKIVHKILQFTIEKLKLSHENLLRHSSSRRPTKEIASWASGLIKMTTRLHSTLWSRLLRRKRCWHCIVQVYLKDRDVCFIHA